MAQFSTLALIASTAFSVVSSVAGASAQSQRAAALRQQAATQNAIAKAEEQKLRRKQSKRLSAQSALFAARGIDPSAGSALLLQEESAAESEFDALLARAGGLARVNQLEMSAQQASAAASRGLLQAGATAASGTSRVAKIIEGS